MNKEWWNENLPEPTVDNSRVEKYAEELRKLEIVDIKQSRREKNKQRRENGRAD